MTCSQRTSSRPSARPALRTRCCGRPSTTTCRRGARQRMHRRAAEILRSEGADPEAVAAHLLRCDAGGSRDVECLRAAAPLALRRGAPEAAVSYLRRALVEHADSAQRTAVLAELGRAEVADGDAAMATCGRRWLARRTGALGPSSWAISPWPSLFRATSARAATSLTGLRRVSGLREDAAERLECLVIGLSSGDPRVPPSGDPRDDLLGHPLSEAARAGTERWNQR